MGQLFTPLTNTPVTDWTDTAIGPDVPQTILNAVNSLERYTNVPVADAPTRETKIPTAQRYIGQVTYNQATDTFEYWTGTKWSAVNQKNAFPSTVHVMAYPNVLLNPGAYYDYRAGINITTPCVVTMWGKAAGNTVISPTSWGGMTMQLLHNNDVVAGHGNVNAFYPAANGGGQMDFGGWGRFAVDPGSHTIGIRIGAQGNTALSLTLTSVMLMRTSGVSNGAAGVNAFGDW